MTSRHRLQETKSIQSCYSDLSFISVHTIPGSGPKKHSLFKSTKVQTRNILHCQKQNWNCLSRCTRHIIGVGWDRTIQREHCDGKRCSRRTSLDLSSDNRSPILTSVFFFTNLALRPFIEWDDVEDVQTFSRKCVCYCIAASSVSNPSTFGSSVFTTQQVFCSVERHWFMEIYRNRSSGSSCLTLLGS